MAKDTTSKNLMPKPLSAHTPLVREDLLDLHCPCGNDHDFVFTPLCHPTAATVASYDKEHGTLSIECALCDALVAKFSLASRADDPTLLVN